MPRRKSDENKPYIPKPTEWNWETLSERDVELRLKRAREAQAQLAKWCDDLKRQREEMWAALRAALPTMKLSEQRMKLARIEDAGKQLVQVSRLLGQANTAIEYIEERIGMRVAK